MPDWKNIEAVLFDMDGVLTDGAIILDALGGEVKSFHVRDGQLIRFMQQQGMKLGCITGRSSVAAQKRMDALGVDFFRMGIKRKEISLEEFIRETGISANRIAYIGDDVIDLPVLKRVGLALAPADASDWIKPFVHEYTRTRGGQGVLREVFDRLIREKKWEEALYAFFG